MRFPSKVTQYKDSIIALFPAILDQVFAMDYDVLTVYKALKKTPRWKSLSLSEYVQALDCLYALGKIQLEGDYIHYADRN